MPDSLSLPELGTVLTWIVGASVFIIQKLKALVCQTFKGGWTQRIPWWAWLVLSLLLPFGLVALVCTEWAQGIVNPMLPDSLKLSMGFDALLPTALTATIGANGSYAVAKKLGLTKDYSAGGPNDVTAQPGTEQATAPATEAMQPPAQSPILGTASEPTRPVVGLPVAKTEQVAQLVMQVSPKKEAPLYYAIVTQDDGLADVYKIERASSSQ